MGHEGHEGLTKGTKKPVADFVDCVTYHEAFMKPFSVLRVTFVPFVFNGS